VNPLHHAHKNEHPSGTRLAGSDQITRRYRTAEILSGNTKEMESILGPQPDEDRSVSSEPKEAIM
jgi:dihydrodipicolinate reductase